MVAVFFLVLLNNTHFQISYSFWKKAVVTSILLILFDIGIHVFCCFSNPSFRYYSYLIHRLYSNHLVEHLYYSQPNLAHFLRGELRTLGAEFAMNVKGNIELSDEQLNDIKHLTKESKKSINDSLAINPKTNVIFILVESYMSFTSDLKIGGREITPYLNSLKRDSSVYYNGRMKKNVTLGASSDGQFIYMTGLLPLRSIITISKARSTTMPGLPKILGRKSRMVIPTATSMWDQDQMCSQYGFNELYAIGDYSKTVQGNLTDEQVFELAIRKDKESQQPFFSVVLTITMHQPYVEQIDSSFPIKDRLISDELANYLNACHYTDMQIGKYLEWLKEAGLYDNSLILIAADHPVDNTDFGGVIDDIPLYIINAGIGTDNMWHGECNQVDLYTTLLDLLGCGSNWYGLGRSLLSPNYENSVNEHSFDVSEWIMFGDYFCKYSSVGN